MAWQKCPICNGTGLISSTPSSVQKVNCDLCDGKKIISELTGLPPAYSATERIVQNNFQQTINKENERKNGTNQ